MALLPIILAVLAGIVFGLARAGRFSAIARAQLRHAEFLAVAIVCSIYVNATSYGPSVAIAVVGLVGALAFTVVNVHLAGMAIIAVGVIFNLAPVGLNGAMPVRAGALVEAEMIAIDEVDRVSLTGARELESSDTNLPWLGDTYPVRWTNQVVSLGDIIMLVGLADVVANLMLTRRRRRRRLPPSALASLEALGWNEDELDLTGDPIDLQTLIDLRNAVDLRDQPVEASSSSTASPVHD